MEGAVGAIGVEPGEQREGVKGGSGRGGSCVLSGVDSFFRVSSETKLLDTLVPLGFLAENEYISYFVLFGGSLPFSLGSEVLECLNGVGSSLTVPEWRRDEVHLVQL